jgi:hypothetical protein
VERDHQKIREAISKHPLTVDQLTGFNPAWASNFQYVVGKITDGDLWLLYGTYPPQTDRVSAMRSKFLVFGMNDEAGTQALVSLWHKTCIWGTGLELFSLAELGVVTQA